MKWNLVHSDVAAVENSGIISKSFIILENEGMHFQLAKMDKTEDHMLGSKRALVDTAHLLKRLAREMEKKADSLK